MDTGLKPGSSFILEVDASLAGYEPKRAEQLYRNLNERLAALPGVERASISATVPFGMISLSKNVQRAGVRPGPEAKPANAAEGLAFNGNWNGVGADYFSTVGLPVLRGRTFSDTEATEPGGVKVAIIDDVLGGKEISTEYRVPNGPELFVVGRPIGNLRWYLGNAIPNVISWPVALLAVTGIVVAVVYRRDPRRRWRSSELCRQRGTRFSKKIRAARFTFHLPRGSRVTFPIS